MGCGASSEVPSQQKDATPVSPRTGKIAQFNKERHGSSVSFQNSEHPSARGGANNDRRDSLKSVESMDFGHTGWGGPIFNPLADVSYQEFSDDVKVAIEALVFALDTNERECERVRRETHERRAEREAQKEEKYTSTAGALGRRSVAATNADRNFDRPPTPTGYYTEEPSATSAKVQSVLTKFAGFFGGGSNATNLVPTATEAEIDADNATGIVSKPQVPMSKYAASDNGGGSSYQPSLGGWVSAHGSMVSNGTKGSLMYAGPNGEDIVVDEQAMRRTEKWTDDHIAVIIRVPEALRRKQLLQPLSGSGGGGSDPLAPPHGVTQDSSGGAGSALASQSSLIQMCPTPTGDTEVTGESQSSQVVNGMLKSFVPTISLDPLAVPPEPTHSLPNNAAVVVGGGAVGDAPTSSGQHPKSMEEPSRSAQGPSTASNVGGGGRAAGGQFAVGRGARPVGAGVAARQETYLSKRNLDKLQERIVLLEATGSPGKADVLETSLTRLQEERHASITGSSTAGPSVTTPAAPPVTAPQQHGAANLGTGGATGGDAQDGNTPMRKRAASRYDDNLLFQELV